MTTTTTERRSLFDVVLREPLALAAAQPHQVLLSTGSVAIMAQFAAHSGIVHPFVGYCIAAGVEWAYLRGLASDGRAPGVWGARLNWSAFGVVVLWGVLWVALLYGVIPAKPEGLLGWLLAAVHIVPIAWLSLCSAMCHRTAHAAEVRQADEAAAREAERAIERERAREALALEMERERQRIALWEQAQEAKARIKASTAQSASLAVRTARTASQEGASASVLACPHCGAAVADAGAKGRAVRYGHCAACKGERA